MNTKSNTLEKLNDTSSLKFKFWFLAHFVCFSVKCSRNYICSRYSRDELSITLFLKKIMLGSICFYCLKTVLKVKAIHWKDQIQKILILSSYLFVTKEVAF